MRTKLLVVLLGLLLWASPVLAVTAILSWNPSTDPRVIKYRIYRSQGTPVTTNDLLLAEVVVPNTQYVDVGIDSTKFYAITAVNDLGQESDITATTMAQYPLIVPTGECTQ